VGYTTGLVPAMTLGPGTWAGSSTSDNIGPLHLINIKRLAYETREYRAPGEWGVGSGTIRADRGNVAHERNHSPLPTPSTFTPSEVRAMVDDFLAKHRASRSRA
ncbi:MAG: hypothetical protein Q7J79_01735, partial [Gemmatimonadales bacterium]|nr:hypothetical protein [Gemmatimonadales bacterium]